MRRLVPARLIGCWRPSGQPFLALRWHRRRTSHQISLNQVHPELGHRVQLLLRFDPLDDHRDSGLGAEAGDRLEEFQLHPVVARFARKLHVELDEIGLDHRDDAQPRIRGAHVIHRELETGLLYDLDGLPKRLEVLDRGVFGDLEYDLRHASRRYGLHQPGVEDGARLHVDEQELIGPQLADRAQGVFATRRIELHDQVRLVGDSEEDVGRGEFPLRPAAQRLETENSVGVQVHDGLVQRADAVAGENRAQLARAPASERFLLRRRFGERLVDGAIHQSLEPDGGVLLHHRGADEVVEPEEQIRMQRFGDVSVEPLDDARLDAQHIAELERPRAPGRREHQDEYVAVDGKLRERVLLSQRFVLDLLQALGDTAHDAVEEFPPVDVLELRESRDVNREDSDGLPAPERLLDLPHEQRQARERGDRVKEQLARADTTGAAQKVLEQLTLEPLLFGHVLSPVRLTRRAPTIRRGLSN